MFRIEIEASYSISEGGLRRQRALVDPWAGARGSQCPRCSEQREDAGGIGLNS